MTAGRITTAIARMPTHGVAGGGGLSPIAYDPAASAYFAAVEDAGGSFDLTGINATYTETYVKNAHDILFSGLKADGLWDKLTEFYLLLGKTFDGITIKAKGTGALINNGPFVAGDYVVVGTGAGLTDSTGKHLDTGLDLSSLYNTTDGFTFGLSVKINTYTSNGRIFGAYGGAGDEARFTTITAASAIAGSPGGVVAAFSDGLASCAVKHGEQKLYIDGTEQSNQTTTGWTIPSETVYIAGINGLSGDTDNVYRVAYIADFLGATQQAAMASRINAFITALT